MNVDAFTNSFGPRRGVASVSRYPASLSNVPKLLDALSGLDWMTLKFSSTVGEGCALGAKCEAELNRARLAPVLALARSDFAEMLARQDVSLSGRRAGVARAMDYALLCAVGHHVLSERDRHSLWISLLNATWWRTPGEAHS